MSELFILALLGHLIGDFLLQSKRMALGKGERGWRGFWLCTIHVVFYTATMCTMLQTIDWRVAISVFVPHWLVDRYSLADKWLKLIRGRTFEAAQTAMNPYREFDIAFTCIVYTVTDSTLHLLSLLAAINLVA